MPIMKQSFPLERCDEIQAEPQRFRLLEQLPWDESTELPILLSDPSDEDQYLILLDTETTGVDKLKDGIVELGMLAVRYNPTTANLVMIADKFSELEDCGVPISAESQAIHGISQADVEGMSFDDDYIGNWMSPASLVVAHNAGFDRAFFDRRFTQLGDKAWACSFFEMPWRDAGFESGKLEYLLYRNGYFYDGHRALTDCFAMAWLFYLQPDLLKGLLTKSASRTVLVRAFGAPIEVKDILKARGYRFDDGRTSGANKHWWKEVEEGGLMEERAFLDETYRDGANKAGYEHRDATKRHKMA
jgi:DNA polymerase III subunit epsilon